MTMQSHFFIYFWKQKRRRRRRRRWMRRRRPDLWRAFWVCWDSNIIFGVGIWCELAQTTAYHCTHTFAVSIWTNPPIVFSDCLNWFMVATPHTTSFGGESMMVHHFSGSRTPMLPLTSGAWRIFGAEKSASFCGVDHEVFWASKYTCFNYVVH